MVTLPHDLLKRSDLKLLALILLLAAVTRLFNLDSLGPFIDETGHIDRAKRYDYFPLYQRIGMGKVLGYALFYPTAQWASNPLYATRLLVGFTGILTTAGIFLLTHRLGGRSAAILAGLMWAILPYVTFHDRLSLHDPLVSLFMVWATLFAIGAAKSYSWPQGMMSGLLLVCAVLVKITAFLWALWLFSLSFVYIDSKDIRKYTRTALVFIVAATVPALMVLIFLILNLSPFLELAKFYADLFVGAEV